MVVENSHQQHGNYLMVYGGVCAGKWKFLGPKRNCELNFDVLEWGNNRIITFLNNELVYAG